MSDTSILKSLAPYHIIGYGTLLGSQFWQSFVGGIISFRALPRPQFSALQQRLFPIYFTLQTSLPVLIALTYPSASPFLPSSLPGVLAPENRASVLYPLAAVFVTSLLNLLVVGPATTRTMSERKAQETRDGKKSYDAPPHSREMVALNKKFGKLHGISSLLNLAGFLATVWYGVSISARL